MAENSSSRKESIVGPTTTRKKKKDEDAVKCSGRYFRSCTAGVIADCVALCCCPCALLNLLTLALVKVPWKMGKRCLGLGKRKKKKRNRVEMERKCEKMREFSTVFGVEENFGYVQETGHFSARFEAERVWLELYQVGHFGFGRVSFTGT